LWKARPLIWPSIVALSPHFTYTANCADASAMSCQPALSTVPWRKPLAPPPSTTTAFRQSPEKKLLISKLSSASSPPRNQSRLKSSKLAVTGSWLVGTVIAVCCSPRSPSSVDGISHHFWNKPAAKLDCPWTRGRKVRRLRPSPLKSSGITVASDQ